ncbi:MAG: hypothetical protein JWM68_5648 [Verrucomicrobiales bacterium]|nr:hypothetical protein [Verrucomicrobiales bacterium]
MKVQIRESGNYWQRCFQSWGFWWNEMRLRLDLRYSSHFKRFCEKRNCPNLAKFEEEYIQEIKTELASLQQRRTALKGGRAPLLTTAGAPQQPARTISAEDQV